MGTIPNLPGITSRIIATPRLSIHALESGPADGEVVLFIHGNASSSTFWEETMLALPDGFRAIAPDLRGYGDTEDLLIDATRGVGDWVDDLLSLIDTLNVTRLHVAGHSLGGTVVFGLVAARPGAIASLTVVAPGSPYGFGGVRPDGTPCFPDGAGSGAGSVNPEFARRMGEGDRSTDDPQASPRNVMNGFFWKPPFVPAREEALLSGLLSEKMGGDRYPGDSVPSDNWPGTAPGSHGPVNAISATHSQGLAERFLAIETRPPVLWVRGDSDAIVSDASLFDLGNLGKLGFVPGYPGEDVFPPQPMVSQVRAVLDRYTEAGGSCREVVIADAGHTPFIEKPEAFAEAFHPHIVG
ncbi:MAG: pimeloyl-ACP methyl ester carboxylesterase [Myxococcota bacterium]|jgi:pimeloyl-ACP methyl ester carboxylesterase